MRGPAVVASATLLAGALAAQGQPAPDRRFGVLGSQATGPAAAAILADLGAGSVRFHLTFEGNDPDPTPLLSAGIAVVITFKNRDAANVDTTYGTPSQWPNAGFPCLSHAAYQQAVTAALTPILPLVASGAQVWEQCENEAFNATEKPLFPFWRGADQQYLTQLAAFTEAVRALDSRIRVVLTSFSSETLDAAVNPGDPDNATAVAHIEAFLASADYNVSDLHLYACVESIPSKILFVASRLPSGKPWIATENGGPDPRCATTPGDWASNPQAYEQLEAEQVPQRLGSSVTRPPTAA
jgi:hypothetical protein